MLALERLRADHADALFAFERENRAYFSRTISDRGDDYFTDFAARHQALIDYQDAGTDHFHVLVDDTGAIHGRVNLVEIAGGEAELGYRIAEHAAGRGLATRTVGDVCRLAAGEYRLRSIRAKTTLDNIASHKVLTRNGFTVTGDAVCGDKPGRGYRRALSG